MNKRTILFVIVLLSFIAFINAQYGRKVNSDLLTNLSFRNSSKGSFYTGIKPIDAVSINRGGNEYLIAIFQDFDEDPYAESMVLAVYKKYNNKWTLLRQRDGDNEYEYLESTLDLAFNGTQVFFETQYPFIGTYPHNSMYFILYDYLEDKVLSVMYSNFINIKKSEPKSRNAYDLHKGGEIEVQYTYDSVTPEMMDFLKMKIVNSGNITEPFLTQNDKENTAKSWWSYYENNYKEKEETETQYKKQKTIKSSTEGINVDELNIGMSIKQVKDIINVPMKLETKSNNSTIYKVVNFEGIDWTKYEVYFLYFNRNGILEEINTGEIPADIEIEIKN